jgi:hypothetical protein
VSPEPGGGHGLGKPPLRAARAAFGERGYTRGFIVSTAKRSPSGSGQLQAELW